MVYNDSVLLCLQTSLALTDFINFLKKKTYFIEFIVKYSVQSWKAIHTLAIFNRLQDYFCDRFFSKTYNLAYNFCYHWWISCNIWRICIHTCMTYIKSWWRKQRLASFDIFPKKIVIDKKPCPLPKKQPNFTAITCLLLHTIMLMRCHIQFEIYVFYTPWNVVTRRSSEEIALNLP